MIFDFLSVIIPLVVIVMLLVSMIKILREYETRGDLHARSLLGCQGTWADHRHSGAAADAPYRLAHDGS